MTTKINNKYIVLGIVLMVLVYLIEMGFVEFVSNGIPIPFSERPSSNELPIQDSTPAPLVTLIVNVVIEILRIIGWFVPGFLVGRKLQQGGLIHGAIIGGIGALITQTMTMTIFGLTTQTNYPIFWIIWSMATMALLCSLAGGAGELLGQKKL